MKIRYGHVTNSSSTSYLIVIDKKTKDSIDTVDEFIKEFGWGKNGSLEQIQEEYDINPEIIKRIFEKGWHLLSTSAGGQPGYNEGTFEFLLEQGGIKMLAELWCGEDFDLSASEEYRQAIDDIEESW